MEGFKFNLGDLVICKTAVAEIKLVATMGEFRTPSVFMITGRYYEECSGGVQRGYAVTGDRGPVRYHEMELMLFSEFDMVDDFEVCMLKKAELRDKARREEDAYYERDKK